MYQRNLCRSLRARSRLHGGKAGAAGYCTDRGGPRARGSTRGPQLHSLRQPTNPAIYMTELSTLDPHYEDCLVAARAAFVRVDKHNLVVRIEER